MAEVRTRTTTRIGKGGRLVIPAEVRRELGLREGETVTVEVRDGELRVYSAIEGIRRAQAIADKYKRPGVSIVDEFIAERRAEAARE